MRSKKQKRSLLFLCALWLSTLTSCASPPPAINIYKELTPDRAYYVNTMTADEGYIDSDHKVNGKTWWDIRPTTISMTAEDWAKIKAWIIKSCKQTKCDQNVPSWDRSIDAVDWALEQ